MSQKRVRAVADRAFVELRLAAEARVERRLRRTGGGRDLLHARLAVAVRGELGSRCREDHRVAVHARAPHRCLTGYPRSYILPTSKLTAAQSAASPCPDQPIAVIASTDLNVLDELYLHLDREDEPWSV